MKLNKILSALLALMLAASLMVGCGTAASGSNSPADSGSTSASATVTCTVKCTLADGSEKSYTLTGETGVTMAEALLGAELISKEEADAGFFTVFDGVKTDYNTDGSWWCVKDAKGEDSMVGIKEIVLEDGATYGVVYTK